MARETYSAIMRKPDGQLACEIWFVLFPSVRVSHPRRKGAVDKARLALEAHLDALAGAGHPIPMETIDDEQVHHHAAGGTGGDDYPIFIDVELPEDGAERINVYLPKSLIRVVDAYAETKGMSRSSVISTAIRKHMEGEFNYDPLYAPALAQEILNRTG